MKEKLKTIILIIAIITLAMIVILNIRYEVTISRYEEHTEIQNLGIGKLLLSLSIGILMIFLVNFINTLKIPKVIKIAIMVVAMLLYAIFQVMWIKYCILIKPGADSDIVYGGAKRLFNQLGTSETMLQYLAYYKQNIGLVVIFKKIMDIFQMDSLNLFRYLNVIANMVMVIGLYWIYYMVVPKENKKNSLLFYILTFGVLPVSLLTTWVYGDLIGLSLSVWSVAFIIKYNQTKKMPYFIASSISMAFAIMARNNSLIFIIAIVIYILFSIGEEKEKKAKLLNGICVILFIAISMVPNELLMNWFSNKYDLNNKKEKSTITYLYMGMSEGKMANGWYNDEVGEINIKMMKQDKADKSIENETKEKLKERVKYLLGHPIYTLEFYKDKILSMWAEPTMASEIYNTQRGVDPTNNQLFVLLMEGNNFEILKLSQKIIDGMIYTGTLICVILKRKNMSNEMLLLVLIFLGGFGFHLLWEAKSRYILPYVVILIPVAVEGMDEITKYLRKKKEEKVLLLKKGEQK